MMTGTAFDDVFAARSVVELFRLGAKTHPDRQAVIMVTDPDREEEASALTYGQLDAAAAAVAAQLREACQPQDRVLLLYPSGLEFVSAFLGCLYAGVIAVPAPSFGRRQHHQQRRRLTGIQADAEVALVLTSDRDRETVQGWLADEGLNHVACETTNGLDAHCDDPVDEDIHEIFDAEPETIAFLQYTSGSTGEPKGVVLTHRNLLYNMSILARTAEWRAPQLRICSWLPLYHDMGLIGTLLWPLVQGGVSVLLDPINFLRRPSVWLRTMDRYEITVSVAPSFAYALCVRRTTDAEIAGLDLSGVERLYNGSESIDSGAMKGFLDRFASAGLRRDVFVPCYGLAEATLVVSVKPGYDPDVPTTRPGAGGLCSPARATVSCGPARYLDLRIVDPSTAVVLPDGQEGEIWVRGPSVSSGYWGREEQTRQTFGGFTADGEGPFLRTGDLGVLRAGELHVSGRIKEVIVVHGQKIFPQDIEHELRAKHPELGNIGAIFALPSSTERTHEPVIVVHEVAGLSAGRLTALAYDVMHTTTEEFGVVIESVVFVHPGTIPRTTSGKVKRIETRDLYTAGALKPIKYHTF